MKLYVTSISSGFHNIADAAYAYEPKYEAQVLDWCGECITYGADVDAPDGCYTLPEWGEPLTVDAEGNMIVAYIERLSANRAKITLIASPCEPFAAVAWERAYIADVR